MTVEKPPRLSIIRGVTIAPLAVAMKRAEKSLRDLVPKVGASHTAIANFVNGRTMLRPVALRRLGRELDMSEDELLYRFWVTRLEYLIVEQQRAREELKRRRTDRRGRLVGVGR